MCFNSIPPRVTFLAALVGDPSPEPTKKKRRVCQRTPPDEPVEEILVEEAVNNTQDFQALFASEVQAMKKALKEKCSAARNAAVQNSDGETVVTTRHKGEIDMIPFLVNPKSYTQTIENFMNLSHLLKKGHAGVRKADNGVVYIRSISSKRKQCPQHAGGNRPPVQSCTQVVLSLTMKDWRALVQAYGLTGGDAGLPHRTYGQPATKMPVEANKGPAKGVSQQE